MSFATHDQIARRVYRALKTPSDDNRLTDPVMVFRFDGLEDQILMRCYKTAEISIKGQDQQPGRVKFFDYSEFREHDPDTVVLDLRDRIREIELYRKGAVEGKTFGSWHAFESWLTSLEEGGVQISLKLPCLVYAAVKDARPSMQNFIVEAVKRVLKESADEAGEREHA
jgi:hypothetical protein